jgi:hypothetical protein
MIDRYTIKFGPAVSQKELEKKILDEGTTADDLKKLHRIKARIEPIGDPEEPPTPAFSVCGYPAHSTTCRLRTAA